MAALPFDAQPGERWIYGYNTDIFAQLIPAQGLDDHDKLRSLIYQAIVD